MEQNTQEWFDARKNRITASSVGAILGMSPFTKQEDILRRMVREWHGASSEFEGNVATEWGKANEKEALDEFFIQTGHLPIPVGFIALGDWAGASPDGLIGDKDIIEVKCPYGLRNQKEPKFKNILEQKHYYAQIQFQLICTNRSGAWFFQWAKHGSKIEYVSRNTQWELENIPKLKEFYELFLEEIGNDDHLVPKLRKIESFTANELIAEIDEINESIKQLEARKSIAILQLEDIAKGESIEIAGRKFQKVSRAGSVNYSKVVKDLLPDLDLKPYRGKSTEYWSLSAKKKDE